MAQGASPKCQEGLFLYVPRQPCLDRVSASHHASAQVCSQLERPHSWPVWMAGDGQGAIPVSKRCTGAWAHRRGGTSTVLSPSPDPAPTLWLPTARGSWLAAPGHLNILIGNL